MDIRDIQDELTLALQLDLEQGAANLNDLSGERWVAEYPALSSAISKIQAYDPPPPKSLKTDSEVYTEMRARALVVASDCEGMGGGRVWDTEELTEDYEVISFMAPFVYVKRKKDERTGTLTWCGGHPRFYYNFVSDFSRALNASTVPYPSAEEPK